MHFLRDVFHALIKGVHGQILLLNWQRTVSFTENIATSTIATVTTHQGFRFPIQSLLHQLDDVLFGFNGLSKMLFTYTTIAVYTTRVSLLLLVLLAA